MKNIYSIVLSMVLASPLVSEAASFTIPGPFPGTTGGLCDSTVGGGSACANTASLPLSGAFSDNFSFTTGPNSGGSSSIVQITNASFANITGISADLDGIPFQADQTGLTNVLSLPLSAFPVLSTGISHIITVAGTVVQTVGGASYGGIININPVGVGAVPVPAALWLFGSALVGLVSLTGRKKQ